MAAAVPQQVSQQIGGEHQNRQPGMETQMGTKPVYILDTYKGSGKLLGKVALITGGDSGIGRAVALAFAREGARGIAIVYKDEHQDAKETVQLVTAEGCQHVIAISGDISDSKVCDAAVQKVVKELGGLDIIINNAGIGRMPGTIMDITPLELRTMFATNVFSMFYIVRAALPYLQSGASIINTSSVVAYKGMATQLDYAATKGAIMSFTRSLATQLMPKGIRVNAVAPGPIWTPLIPATHPEEKTESFGEQTPMKRPGQPYECAGAYVFLASSLSSSYITGQTLHPNGGVITNV